MLASGGLVLSFYYKQLHITWKDKSKISKNYPQTPQHWLSSKPMPGNSETLIKSDCFKTVSLKNNNKWLHSLYALIDWSVHLLTLFRFILLLFEDSLDWHDFKK